MAAVSLLSPLIHQFGDPCVGFFVDFLSFILDGEDSFLGELAVGLPVNPPKIGDESA